MAKYTFYNLKTKNLYPSNPLNFTKSKFYNSRTKVNGITFDSKKEAARYSELLLLQKNKDISELKIQPKFVLQEGFTKNGMRYRAINYIADFQYKDKDGKIIIEDVKGSVNFKTAVYKIKKKLFEKKYPELSIVEVY